MTKQYGPKNVPLRRTMIKDKVGTVKKPSFDLPDMKNADHTYGYEVQRDDEDAGQVLGKWVEATPSQAAKSNRSFIETNRRALANGCITSKGTREFANSRPEILIKKVSKEKTVYIPPSNVTYGIRSGLSENVTDLIQARHTSFTADEPDYPDLSTMQIKGKLPLPRETKCSIGKDRRLRHDADGSKSPFKMKKFEKITTVMSTQPKSKLKKNIQTKPTSASQAPVAIADDVPEDQEDESSQYEEQYRQYQQALEEANEM